MLALVKAEHIKMKHTVASALVLVIPIVSLVCCFLMSWSYLYGMSMVWWDTLFIYVTIALLCALVNQKEDRKLQYRNVYQLPVPLKRVWRAKIYMIVGKTILASNMFGLLLCLAVFSLTGAVERGVGITILALNLVWILNIWQIPFFLGLAKKAGFYLPVLLGVVFGAAGTILAQTKIWWAFPIAWCSRIMCTVIGYQPNGLPITEGNEAMLLSFPIIAVYTILSLALFIILTWLTAVLFVRGQKRC